MSLNTSDLSNKLAVAKQFIADDMYQNNVSDSLISNFNNQMDRAIRFAIEGKIYLNQKDMLDYSELLVLLVITSLINDHGSKLLDLNPVGPIHVGLMRRWRDRNWWRRWYLGFPGWRGWQWYWLPYFWWRFPVRR